MKKKILFRIGSLEGWGAEKSLINLLYHLDYSKYEVDVILCRKTGVYLKQLPRQVHLLYIGNGNEFLSKIFFFRFLQKVWRHWVYKFYHIFPYFFYNFKLKNKKYDIEIGFLHGYAPQLIKSPLKSKKIAWVHTDFKKEHDGGRFKNIGLTSLKQMDKIFAVSKQVKDVLLSLAPNLEKTIQVLYNSVDKEDVIRKANEKTIERKEDKLQLIAVGRFAYPKGFERLINVCHRLRKDGFDFKLYILGQGLYRDKLAKQLKTLRLEDVVELLEYQENPYPYIRAADIFVMSSHYEGMPYVVLEALILNKPIVSTDVVGPRELLKDGELGLLVENSEEGLYQGLKRMITDKTLRESFIHKKKDFSAFEPTHIAKQVEEVLDHL